MMHGPINIRCTKILQGSDLLLCSSSQFLQNFSSNLKFIGARMVIRNKYHTEDIELLGANNLSHELIFHACFYVKLVENLGLVVDERNNKLIFDLIV